MAGFRRWGRRRHFLLWPLLMLLFSPAVSHAAWTEGAWQFRRPIDVDWIPDKTSGEEITYVNFYTAGAQQLSGDNIRVADENNKLVPCRVLMIGPGNRMRVLFAPTRGIKRHYVYFGHPKPPAMPRNLSDPPITSGLLMEMRKLEGPLPNNLRLIQTAFEKAGKVIGRTMVSRLYIGFNPFSDNTGIISRYNGTLQAPVNGTYTFAGSASNHGACSSTASQCYGCQAWCPTCVSTPKPISNAGPTRSPFTTSTRPASQRISVVWKKPDTEHYELIPPNAFGVMPHATVGVLEDKDKTFVVNMKIEYVGEYFFADHYSHHYRFTLQGAKASNPSPPRYDWDFGDGQTATGTTVDHVFLTDGEYAIKLAGKAGFQADTKTNRIVVSRLHEQIDNPPGDVASAQGKIVAGYDLGKMPPRWIPFATQLLERAKEHAVLEKAAMKLAVMRDGVDPGFGMNTLAAATFELCSSAKFDAAARIWDAVPQDSPFQPSAAQHYGELLVWRLADFEKAIKVVEPLAAKNPQNRALQRLLAYALVLNQKPEGVKMVRAMKGDGPADRQAALTGAEARSIEFYIGNGDWETGEQVWEKWAHQFPADFLEGYGVLLRTRLMEMARAPEAAAKVAEGFAKAVPKSSYAPRLLDRASKLLEKTDQARSKSLRDYLKEKYPEDPLSQDQK